MTRFLDADRFTLRLKMLGPMSAVRPQILVIDDEPQIHRFLSPALDAAGSQPRRAARG